jgi:hypothetical protein
VSSVLIKAGILPQPITVSQPVPATTIHSPVPVVSAIAGITAGAALLTAGSAARLAGGSVIGRNLTEFAHAILTKTLRPDPVDLLADALDPFGLGLSQYFKKTVQEQALAKSSQKPVNGNAQKVSGVSERPTSTNSVILDSDLVEILIGTGPVSGALSAMALSGAANENEISSLLLNSQTAQSPVSADSVEIRTQSSEDERLPWPKIGASLSASLTINPESIGWATVAGGHPGFFPHLFSQISFDGDASLKDFLTTYSRETEPAVRLVRRAVADVFSHYCSFYGLTPGAMGNQATLELKRTERGFEIRLQGRPPRYAPQFSQLNISDETDSAFARFPRRMEGSLALFPLGGRPERRTDTEGVFVAFVPIPTAYLRSQNTELPYLAPTAEGHGDTGRAPARVSYDKQQGHGRQNPQDQQAQDDHRDQDNQENSETASDQEAAA